MAQVYGLDADRKEAQSAILAGVQKRFKIASLETKMETACDDQSAPRRTD